MSSLNINDPSQFMDKFKELQSLVYKFGYTRDEKEKLEIKDKINAQVSLLGSSTLAIPAIKDSLSSFKERTLKALDSADSESLSKELEIIQKQIFPILREGETKLKKSEIFPEELLTSAFLDFASAKEIWGSTDLLSQKSGLTEISSDFRRLSNDPKLWLNAIKEYGLTFIDQNDDPQKAFKKRIIEDVKICEKLFPEINFPENTGTLAKFQFFKDLIAEQVAERNPYELPLSHYGFDGDDEVSDIALRNDDDDEVGDIGRKEPSNKCVQAWLDLDDAIMPHIKSLGVYPLKMEEEIVTRLLAHSDITTRRELDGVKAFLLTLAFQALHDLPTRQGIIAEFFPSPGETVAAPSAPGRKIVVDCVNSIKMIHTKLEEFAKEKDLDVAESDSQLAPMLAPYQDPPLTGAHFLVIGLQTSLTSRHFIPILEAFLEMYPTVPLSDSYRAKARTLESDVINKLLSEHPIPAEGAVDPTEIPEEIEEDEWH